MMIHYKVVNEINVTTREFFSKLTEEIEKSYSYIIVIYLLQK